MAVTGSNGEAGDISVLCVDDSDDIVMVLEMVVNGETGMRSAGVLNRADDLLDAVGRSHPNVVLLDLKMPGKDPLIALAELSERFPGSRTIVFSAYDDHRAVDQAVAAGAWGYLRKGCDMPVIVDTIRRVANGERVVPEPPSR